MDVGVIKGAGTIRANGGASSYYAGGGGGGRIAVYYSDASQFNLSTQLISTGGVGNNGQSGAAGTVYNKNKTTSLDAIKIDNTGVSLDGGYTDITAATIEASVTITKAKAKLSGNISGDLILSGATVRVLDGSSSCFFLVCC